MKAVCNAVYVEARYRGHVLVKTESCTAGPTTKSKYSGK